MNIGYANRAFNGASICGDAGAWWQAGRRRVLALADGLGHGPAAHHAALTALQCIERHAQSNCAELFAACDAKLIETRGAVLAIAIIDLDSNLLTLASIGNIRSILLTPNGDVRLSAGRGIVGAGYAWTPPDQRLLAPGDTLVLFSDGIDAMAGVRSCLGGVQDTPQMVAERLLANWARDTDDASVLVYRHAAAA